MIDQDKILKAEQAKQILDDDLVTDVLAGLRTDALEALAKADTDDTKWILKLQAKVAVIDDFKDDIEAFILVSEESGGDVA